MIDASIKGTGRSLQPLSANPFQRLGGTSKQAAEQCTLARNAPTKAEARIDFGRRTRRRSATLPRDSTSRGAPLSFHDVGLWIGVDKKLAPFREPVKI